MSTPPPVPPDLPELPPVPGSPPPMPPPVPYPQAVAPPPGGHNGNGTRSLVYGCLGMLAVAGILVVIGGIWAFRKAKGIAENPEQFIAEMAVKSDPDLELVRVDKAAREVVIRNKKSGESTTFSFDELKNGKLTLKNSNGSSAELGAGGIRMQDKEGLEAVVGAGEAVPLPDWVPRYPGTQRVLMSSHQQLKGGYERGESSFTTSDPIDTAASHYVKMLEAAAFEVAREETATDGVREVSLQATASPDAGGSKRIAIRLVEQGKTVTLVNLDYAHTGLLPDEPVEK